MVIVGAGQAGGRAALGLRAAGYDGRVLLLGEEADAPYERPPLSKGFLTGERAAASFTFATLTDLNAAGIEFRPSCTVEAIDRKDKSVRLAGGARATYAKLLLATGRTPRRLALAGTAADRVHYLRDLGDAERLKRALVGRPRLLVLGGGFIGLEVAASAVAHGCRPIVVEQAAHLLSRAVPPALAGFLQTRHEAAGVEVLLGTRVEQVEQTDDGLFVNLSDGRLLAADLMLVGIGAVPRTALAEAAGLAVDDGIVVDATLRTSDPDIFAAGDVCAFPAAPGAGLARLESWQNADAQGALAARNMLGAGEAYAALPWFWSDQYELTLQMAGYPQAGGRLVERDVGAQARLLFHLDAGNRLVGVSGVGPPALAREVRVAQIMIERGLSPAPSALADPATKLKGLLR